IPVAVAGIPGGVMSATMVEHAVKLKALGLAGSSIRKMASGSVIGTLIALPASFVLAWVLSPLADSIAEYADQVFIIGAVVLALMSRHRWIALASLIPFAVAIQAVRSVYQTTGAVPEGTEVFVSLFLGITIGLLIYNLFELIVRDKRSQLKRESENEITLYKTKPIKGLANPFKILNRKEQVSAAAGAGLGTLTFFLTPVGMTILIGEALSSRVKGVVARSNRAISTMDSLTNASYIAGILVPVLAIGIPISPMAIGPGNALFNAPPVLTLENNVHHLLSTSEIVVASLIGAAVALLLTYQLTVRYAEKIGEFVF